MQKIWARVTAERTGRGGRRWGGRRDSELAATELLSQEMPHATRGDTGGIRGIAFSNYFTENHDFS